MAKLGDHRRKRRPLATNEPLGEAPAGELAKSIVERALTLGGTRTADKAACSEAAWPLLTAKPGDIAGDGWVFDAELGGVRVLAVRDGDVVSLRTFDASGAERPVEAFYPEVVRALRSLPVTRLVLDGELVAFDASGHPTLSLPATPIERSAKREAHSATTEAPVLLVAKDLLALGSVDVRALPLSARRELLSTLLPDLGVVCAPPPLAGSLDAVLASCTSHDLAGVIAKKKSSAYDADEAGWVSVSSGVAPRSRILLDHGAVDGADALRRVPATNRAKVFWGPEDGGYTKGDLCDYYSAIADHLLPYLRERPVILVRYPDGIGGKSFFQWNVPAGMPAWVRTLTIGRAARGGGVKRGFLVDDASTLLYIANLGCIPLHILACRAPRLGDADFFTMDFDVKQSELRHAVTLARALRELLDAVGLSSFPKTSGQSGLHVLVPLGPGQTFDTARAMADLLGKLLVERFPELATLERAVKKRGPRVYVDTGQTGPTRAIVAPYSVRAVPGATVSTPLSWDEVDHGLDPRAYTMKTVPARVAKRGDLLSGLLAARPDVPAAVVRLSELIARRA